jgi:undecaprenyl-diphosphatase
VSAPSLELQAALLGLVQGICEFLPISSSAHLVVLPEVLGWTYLGKGFDVALHAGSLLALGHHFRGELKGLGRAAQRLIFSVGRARDPEARLVKLLAVGSLPAALAGFLLDGLWQPSWQGLVPIALFSIVWGVLMGWTDGQTGRRAASIKTLSVKAAFLIGCAQAAALLPGTSRTGMTIMAALLLGLSRFEAARFSLLLSIPVILGATLFKGWEMAMLAGYEGLPWRVVLVGVGCSTLAGALCLRRFLSYLEYGTLRPLAAYRVLFGAAVLGYYCLTAY